MTGTVAAVFVPTMGLVAGPAVAAAPCVPAGNSATAAADLLRLGLLDLGALGLGAHRVADVVIGDANADMAHAHAQRATASSRYLSATIAGITLPAGLPHTVAQQSAPPVNSAPDEGSAVSVHTAVLDLGVGNVFASAGAAGVYSCGAASAGASVADATLLPGSNGRSLLALPHELNGAADTALVAGAGAGGGYASRARAAAGLARVDLLNGTAAHVGVKVVTEPTLVGTAGGSLATSSVAHTSPVLDVTLPGGQEVRLDAGHPSLDFVTSANASAVSSLVGAAGLPLVKSLGGNARLLVHLSIGAFSSHVGAHAVSGSASTLRLDVSLAKSGLPTGLLSGMAGGVSGGTLSLASDGGLESGGLGSGGAGSGRLVSTGLGSGGLGSGGLGSGDVGSGRLVSTGLGSGLVSDSGGGIGGVVGEPIGGVVSAPGGGSASASGSGTVSGSGVASGAGGSASGAAGVGIGAATESGTAGPKESGSVAGGPQGSGAAVLSLELGALSVTATAPGGPAHCAPGGYGYGGAGCVPGPSCTATAAVAGGGYGSCSPSGPCAQTGGYGQSCSPTTQPSHSTSPSPTVKGTSIGSPGGSLPVTGAATAWIAGIATVLVALGRLMMVMARRRAAG